MMPRSLSTGCRAVSRAGGNEHASVGRLLPPLLVLLCCCWDGQRRGWPGGYVMG